MRRRVSLGLLALAALAALAGLFIWATGGLTGAGRRLPKMPAPTAAERFLVLAPHCDDETLACGAVIALAKRAGAPTHVALVTNGDGFLFAAERLFDEVEVPPKDYVRLGLDRQKETLAAVSRLGLSPDDVTFLGYPDGGSAHMLMTCWAPGQPYTSPRTRDNHNPYPNALRPGGPYCGRFLLDDLETVIRRFRPTTVFCPHPNDTHRDHWALYAYTLAGLHELGMLDKVTLRLYLVHRGDFPTPRGFHPDLPLSPPPPLIGLGTCWETLPLNARLVERKRQAIAQYHSQMLVMRRYLVSFARASELFGTLPLRDLPVIAPGRLRVDGNLADWAGLAPVIRDPAQDLATEDVAPAGDEMALYAAEDGRRLFVRLDLYRPASSELTYAVHLHPLFHGVVGPPRNYFISPGHATPGVQCRAAGRSLEISVPLPSGPAFEGVMLGADSRFQSHLLDRTAWILLRLKRG